MEHFRYCISILAGDSIARKSCGVIRSCSDLTHEFVTTDWPTLSRGLSGYSPVSSNMCLKAGPCLLPESLNESQTDSRPSVTSCPMGDAPENVGRGSCSLDGGRPCMCCVVPRSVLRDMCNKWWYYSSMKVKTSITLSEELLTAIGSEVDKRMRSAFIEEATWRYLKTRRRAVRDQSELKKINSTSSQLNEEAFDVLEYQVEE